MLEPSDDIRWLQQPEPAAPSSIAQGSSNSYLFRVEAKREWDISVKLKQCYITFNVLAIIAHIDVSFSVTLCITRQPAQRHLGRVESKRQAIS